MRLTGSPATRLWVRQRLPTRPPLQGGAHQVGEHCLSPLGPSAQELATLTLSQDGPLRLPPYPRRGTRRQWSAIQPTAAPMRRARTMRWTQASHWAGVAHCWTGPLWRSPLQSNPVRPGETSALAAAWRRMLGPSAILLHLIHERLHGQRWRPRLWAPRPREVRAALQAAKRSKKTVRQRKAVPLAPGRLRMRHPLRRSYQPWLTPLLRDPWRPPALRRMPVVEVPSTWGPVHWSSLVHYRGGVPTAPDCRPYAGHPRRRRTAGRGSSDRPGHRKSHGASNAEHSSSGRWSPEYSPNCVSARTAAIAG